MSSLLDIGSSAILAYRTALTATGENIANANTEGFTRRDVVMTEVKGGQMTASSLNSGGQGVAVQEVRRAFDEFLSQQVRKNASAYNSAETFHTITQSIEDLFLPSVGGIAKGMDQFFSSLSTLSGNPTDIALRQSVLEAGTAMATSISDVAVGLYSLRADVEAQTTTSVGMLNEKLSALAELQKSINGVSNANGGMNTVFDERDRLVGQISEIAGVSVKYDNYGRVEVRLGETMGGPLLLKEDTASVVDFVSSEDLRLEILRDGTNTESTQISGGLIQGFRAALGAIDDSILQLNAFARRIAGDVNTLHASGLNMNGEFGGDLFTMEGWEAKPSTANRGSTFVEFTITDVAKAAELPEFTVTRDAVAGEWVATDSTGAEITRGSTILSLNGLTVTLTGTPLNGDRFLIQPKSGQAVDMRMAVANPEDLAAAAANLVAPLSTNNGSASAVIVQTPVSPPALTDLADILAVSGSGADAVNLLQGGVIGYVPAGAKSLTLAALGLQSTQDFALSDAQAASANWMSIAVGGTTHVFDMTGLGATTAQDIANALNNGTATAAGVTFADLGIQATGTSGALTFALSDGEFDAPATFVSGAGNSTSVLTPSQPAGGSIQVFTRNGVQIAGTPLDAASASALMTTQNGFFDGATYIDDYLYAEGDDGYRGITQSVQTVPGGQVLRLSLGDPLTWDSAQFPPVSAANTLSLSYVAGEDKAFEFEAGMSAARAATTLNDNVDSGLRIAASTSVGLEVNGDGAVEFLIEGSNVEPIKITGIVSGGRLDNLAQVLREAVGATEITATISSDGQRIVLTHPTGEDISVSGFSHSAGGTMDVTASNENGLPSGTPVTLGTGVDSVQFKGTLTFEAASTFALGYGGTQMTSSVDAASGGLIVRSNDAAGSIQSFDFSANADFDGAASSVDGLVSQAANAKFTMTVGSTTVSYIGADPAAGLAAAMRAEAPTATLVGGPISTLPTNGMATSVMIGSDTYVLRMTATGDIDVSGPEEGRLTAAFDGSNRLRVEVADGTLDGATLMVPSGTSGAAAFGLTTTDGASVKLTGQEIDQTQMSATMDIEVAGTVYSVVVSTTGATLPVGFPGTSSFVGNRVTFTFDANVGPTRVLPSNGAIAAGFTTFDMSAEVVGDNLTFTSKTGAALDIDVSVSALASQRVSLDGLPDEDLIIVMNGSSPLRLAGSYVAGEVSPYSPNVTVEVVDVNAKRVRLIDNDTGDMIAERTLDSGNAANFGAIQFALTGTAEDGDGYVMLANNGFIGDGTNINALAALRNSDPTTGKGGFGRILAALQAQKGALVSAAQNRVTVTEATYEGAQRVYADRTAVDLDEQAAKLVEQQQSYQAAAQILSVANDLFDTLLNAI